MGAYEVLNCCYRLYRKETYNEPVEFKSKMSVGKIITEEKKQLVPTL